ncbi:MAG: hypothetical protein J6B26_07805 [Agathobacter sp.]|nr:hypothetical protein [Agathobacter sp.]
MDKLKRIFALLLVLLLLGLYGMTLFFAITDHTETLQYLKVSITATIIVPALMWAYSFIYRTFGKGKKQDEETVADSTEPDNTKETNDNAPEAETK